MLLIITVCNYALWLTVNKLLQPPQQQATDKLSADDFFRSKVDNICTSTDCVSQSACRHCLPIAASKLFRTCNARRDSQTDEQHQQSHVSWIQSPCLVAEASLWSHCTSHLSHYETCLEIWHISAIAQEKQIWTLTTPALTDPCPTCPTYRNSSSVLLPRYSLPILTLTICCLSISLHTCHPTSQKQPFRQSTTTLSAQQTMASIACHSVGLQRGFWHCRPPSPSIRSCFCELHSHKLVWVILDQPDPTLYTSWQADISFPSWLQRSAGY